MKTMITTAPEGVLNNWKRRLHGNHSLPTGWLEAAEYAWGCHYDVEPYKPIFAPILESLKGDAFGCAVFRSKHADELRAEALAATRFQARRVWVQGPSADEIAAKNQAAAAADRLEAEITQRADYILRQREIAARAAVHAEARAQAREELTR